jgi:hypothetical protein
VKHRDAPVKHRDAPVKHRDAPVKHRDAPVKHRDAPVTSGSSRTAPTTPIAMGVDPTKKFEAITLHDGPNPAEKHPVRPYNKWV